MLDFIITSTTITLAIAYVAIIAEMAFDTLQQHHDLERAAGRRVLGLGG